MKSCKKVFLEAVDVDENPISIRKADVVLFGESDSPKYSSYVVVGGTPSGDARFFLKMPYSELKAILG